ncbi:NAD(P)H-dependent oxidoreductase [Alphaproteobacteria bacterium KMM 3653]|uniref:NAD(P)H-dependent oxidoreductase n=1 Tax=Harenicola maris TaxID=2841044 RepID=A0AAP2G9J5_9RHOB|nr:NAD(P)H-dependent oxidoreductase [Harenicola maris]
MTLSLVGLCGSLRKDSFNRKLLNEAVRRFGPADYTEASIRMPLYDGDLEATSGIPAEVQTAADQIAAADAVVIASPEYNQSVPGTLKNALDWISRVEGNPWQDKPVVLLHAAAGRTGGARANYALRLCMAPFAPHLIPGPEVLVAAAHTGFDETGALQGEMYQNALQQAMDALRRAAS